MPLRAPFKVFLEANVVIQAGKPPGGPLTERIADLVKADLITVLTTDLTIVEVAKKHADNDFDVIGPMGDPHFRSAVKDAFGLQLPVLTKADIRLDLARRYKIRTSEMFQGLSATVLSIDSVKPSVVFDAYSGATGFFSGTGKKHQFPDAFIFECLKAAAPAPDALIVVSNDSDFSEPALTAGNITVVKSIPDLFKKLGLEVAAPDVADFLRREAPDLIARCNVEVANWGLLVSDVAEAEIDEVTVTAVEVGDLTSFGSIAKGGDVLVIGGAEVTATVAYTHPDWDGAAWDSEDKVLMPFDSVSGETEVTFQVEFSMSILVDEGGDLAQIDEFRFRDGRFQDVELHPPDDPRF